MDEAEKWRERAIEQENINNIARAERSSVTIYNKLEKPIISDEDKEFLENALKAYKPVKKVWLVQKQLRYYPERSYYLLVAF